MLLGQFVSICVGGVLKTWDPISLTISNTAHDQTKILENEELRKQEEAAESEVLYQAARELKLKAVALAQKNKLGAASLAKEEEKRRVEQIFLIHKRDDESSSEEEDGDLIADKFEIEAAHWEAYFAFKNVARRGHVGAQRELGLCLLGGLGVRKDIKKAAEMFRRAIDLESFWTKDTVDRRDPDALFQLWNLIRMEGPKQKGELFSFLRSGIIRKEHYTCPGTWFPFENLGLTQGLKFGF